MDRLLKNEGRAEPPLQRGELYSCEITGQQREIHTNFQALGVTWTGDFRTSNRLLVLFERDLRNAPLADLY